MVVAREDPREIAMTVKMATAAREDPREIVMTVEMATVAREDPREIVGMALEVAKEEAKVATTVKTVMEVKEDDNDASKTGLTFVSDVSDTFVVLQDSDCAATAATLVEHSEHVCRGFSSSSKFFPSLLSTSDSR